MNMGLSKLWELVKGREAWHAAVHEVTKSWTGLSDRTTKPESLSILLLLRQQKVFCRNPHTSNRWIAVAECLPWKSRALTVLFLVVVPVVQLLSRVQLLRPQGLRPARLLCSQDFPGKSAGVGCHFLLQAIFPIQGSNPGLLHWQVDSLPLSPQRSPKEE